MSDASGTPTHGWHTLVVGDDHHATQIAHALGTAGFPAHAAPVAQARAVMAGSSSFGVVLFDHCHGPAASVAAAMHAEIDGLRFLTLTAPPRGELRPAAPFAHVLPAPFELAHFRAAVFRPLGNCGCCNITLPLRRPLRPEPGERWVCTYCGEHFRACWWEDAPAHVRPNARRNP